MYYEKLERTEEKFDTLTEYVTDPIPKICCIKWV